MLEHVSEFLCIFLIFCRMYAPYFVRLFICLYCLLSLSNAPSHIALETVVRKEKLRQALPQTCPSQAFFVVYEDTALPVAA